ncbi:hypothetical protein [Scytonema sp. NUACC26]|uniref:hypothetical protein n=1 Tax=Scytonema sp. NUACC26 TaxID=3140176 RepID=UPI0034DC5673
MEMQPTPNSQKSIDKLVDFFNLHSISLDSDRDFEIPQATQRIVDSLDLISFFFTQQNYIQGITLLAAAQKTFLKVAILSKIALINETISLSGTTYKVSELVEWVPLGLFLSDKVSSESLASKRNILQKLKFPIERVKLENNDDFQVTSKNFALLAWLQKLESSFKKWYLLQFSCNKRNSDNDLRNQYMHNLRGMEDNDVVEYLLGYSNNQTSYVMEAYNLHVKQPFLDAMTLLNLPYKRENLKKKLQKIADSLV